jgi:ribosomal protein L7Ae-like RNA K-turn-binding protein
MPSIQRVKSFVGFAVRANKIVWGTDNVLAYKKKIRLILVSDGLADNALQKLRAYAESKPARLVVLDDLTVAELVHRDGVKAIGVTDKNLADAIILELE